MNRELRDAIVETVSRTERLRFLNDNTTVGELRRAIERYNDEIGYIEKSARELQRQLDLEDYREYQAKAKLVYDQAQAARGVIDAAFAAMAEDAQVKQ